MPTMRPGGSQRPRTPTARDWMPPIESGSTRSNRMSAMWTPFEFARPTQKPTLGSRIKNNGTSYILNEYLFVDLLDPFGRSLESYRKLDSLKMPSATYVAFDTSDTNDVTWAADHTHSRNWIFGWSAVLVDIQPDRHRPGGPRGEHASGVASYLFADGHVEKIQAASLKAKIDKGINFSEPPK
jgi:prepilin-type processing-associated H-X9-DG protein